MAYPVSERYKEVIYGGDYSHQLKIWFDETELNDADLYCEKLIIKKRILPEGSYAFSLNNFISQSIEITFHGLEESVIKSPIHISIGTLVDNQYEYVPIGTFNITENPTTDQNKITITALDNSVKFDFNYNAEPIITANGGSATKKQIFEDICNQAGIETTVTSFLGENDPIGIYDNTVTARTYIANLAEQAGCIATINREGKLIFIDLTNIETWEIPIDIVESYSYNLHYEIGRIVYESGIIKYETEDSEQDTLYLDASNQYINETTLNSIKDNLIGFEIDSLSTGKILGNPAIDPYDLISIYDDVTDKTYITLATYDLSYSGNMIQNFNTELTLEGVKENVTLKGESTFRRWAKTSIDNVNATVEITTGQVQQISQETNNNYLELLNRFNSINENLSTITELQESVTQLQTSTYTKTEVNQIASGIGVDGQVVTAVKTTSGTFDTDGLTIEQSTADTKTNINADGMIIYNKTSSSAVEDPLLTVNSTGVIAKNVRVSTYLNVGSHSRLEDYKDITGVNGTAVFWIGSDD